MSMNLGKELAAIGRMGVAELRTRYAELFGETTRTGNKPWLRKRIAWRMQMLAEGDISERARQRAAQLAHDADIRLSPPRIRPLPAEAAPRTTTAPVSIPGDHRLPPPGSILQRIYKGATLQVRVLESGFEFEGELYKSLSAVAKSDHRQPLQRLPVLRPHQGVREMKPIVDKKAVRCAIYTRKSSEEGLEQEFNSLDAQRESGEAYIKSQAHEGWECLATPYDDGGFTGGNMDRPALKRLLADIEAGKVDCVVVYKVDRLSRSLLDFAGMMATFERHGISFVSVTQQFNTASSMGRLVLNVLLSFAQFEREIISERTRDKIAATRRKGKWSGGRPILGYDVELSGASSCVVHEEEACACASDLRSLPGASIAHRGGGGTGSAWLAEQGLDDAEGGVAWRRPLRQGEPASPADQRRLCGQGALQERGSRRGACGDRRRRDLAADPVTAGAPRPHGRRGGAEPVWRLAQGAAALHTVRLCDDADACDTEWHQALSLLRVFGCVEARLEELPVEVDCRGWGAVIASGLPAESGRMGGSLNHRGAS